MSTWPAWIEDLKLYVYTCDLLGTSMVTMTWCIMLYILGCNSTIACRARRRRHADGDSPQGGTAEHCADTPSHFDTSLAAAPRAPLVEARRVGTRRMVRARVNRRLEDGRSLKAATRTGLGQRMYFSPLGVRYRWTSVAFTRLVRLLVILMLATHGTHRIGEASNPGPITAFDMPEVPLDYYEEDLEDIDGYVGHASLGFIEAGFAPEATVGRLTAARTAGMMSTELPDPHEGWNREGLTSIEELDERELAAIGLRGTQEQPPPARRELLDPDLILEGPLTQEEATVIEGTVHGSLPLPSDIFQRLQDQDAKEATGRLVKWQTVLARAQCRRDKMIARNAPRKKDADMQIDSEGPTIIESENPDDVSRPHSYVVSDARCASTAAAPTREPRRRARGRRRRNGGKCELWTLNSSGRPQLEAAVQIARDRGVPVLGVMNQEHHQGESKLADLQSWCRASGWRAALTRAVPGRGEGPSAGTAVIVPRHIPCGLQEGMKPDASPSDSPGRITCHWLQAVVPCGFMAIAVYFHHTEGGSRRNLDLLHRALQLGQSSRCPWVIGADWQQSPELVIAWAGGALARAAGRVVRAGECTHYPAAGKAAEIDYFVISDSLAPYVDGVGLVPEVAASPHRAVALRFKRLQTPICQLQLRAPRAFPRRRPIGCQRQPVAPAAADVEMSPGAEDDVRQRATDAWRSLVTAMELELCGITDRYNGESPDPRYCGRATGIKYAYVPVLPPRVAARWGQVDRKTHAMLWADNRLTELFHLSSIASAAVGALADAAEDMRDFVAVVTDPITGEGTGLKRRQWVQWTTVTKRLLSEGSPVVEVLISDPEWKQVLDMIMVLRWMPAEAVIFLRNAVAWARGTIARQKTRHRAARTATWQAWVSNEARRGAGAAHAFVKRTVEPPDVLLSIDGRATAIPQEVVDHDYIGWEGIWHRLAAWADSPWRNLPLPSDGHPLPPITGPDLRKASSTFALTAIGTDNIGPWHYSWLSDELIARFATFLQGLEAVGIWPDDLLEALIHLIPKVTGGRRPIGVLASLLRLWERTRRPVIQAWRDTCARDYQWMARGKGANRAVWAQTVLEEAARQRGLASAAVLIDLVKAFEQVILARVWASGVRLGFPTVVLRLAMELCCARRRLVYRKACSTKAASTLTAILAGSGLASDLMFLMVIEPLDTILKEYDSIRIFVIADDVKIGVTGGEQQVADTMGDVTRRCIQLLEDGLHMQVSRDSAKEKGKTVALGSSTSVRRKLGKRMGKMGISTVRAAKNLGVDFSLGRLGVRTVQLGRLALAQARARRAARLGGRLGSLVVTGSAIPSVTYGVAATGMSDGVLASLRSLVAAAKGKMRGRSTSARLAMDGNDPGLAVVVQPVLDWVSSWWDCLLDHDDMMEAWKYAVKHVGLAPRPNLAVQGGAGAFVAGLRRLGWKTPSPDSVITRDGTILFFGNRPPPGGSEAVDPRSLAKWLKDEYEMMTMVHSSLAAELNSLGQNGGYGRAREVELGRPPIESFYGDTDEEARAAAVWRRARMHLVDGMIVPWIWPMARVAAAARRKGNHSAAASLRACVEGGWWPQARRHAVGMATSSRCKCGEQIGTLWHKLGRCRLSEDARADGCSTSLLRTARVQVWDPLFSRSVPARPRVPPPPKACTWFERKQDGAELLASGKVYTDGSAQGWHWRASRAGYSAVCMDDENRVTWVLRGVCGEPHASIFRAELKAVLETLRVASPPLIIIVDNSEVVRGFTLGEAWCTRSGADGADIWRDVWHRWKDIGGGVTIAKVKAHTTALDVIKGIVTWEDREGNAAADKAAKEALAVAKRDSPAEQFNGQLARAVLWARWVLRYSSCWVDDDGEVDDDVLAPADAATHRVEGSGTRSTIGHELWENARELMCRRCGRTSIKASPTHSFLKEACRGSAAGRAMHKHTGNVNELWHRHHHAMSSLVSRGYALRARSFIPRCAIDEARLAELVPEDQFQALRGHLGLPPLAAAPAAPIDRHQPHHPDHHLHHGLDHVPLTVRPADPPTASATRKRETEAGETRRTVRQRVQAIEAAVARKRGGGEPGDAPHAEDRPAARRRTEYAVEDTVGDLGDPQPWMRDPQWLPTWMHREAMARRADDQRRQQLPPQRADQFVEPEARSDDVARPAGGPAEHSLAVAGPLIFCNRCAAYGLRRMGAKLKGQCKGSAHSDLHIRLDRMRQGRHPITGELVT